MRNSDADRIVIENILFFSALYLLITIIKSKENKSKDDSLLKMILSAVIIYEIIYDSIQIILYRNLVSNTIFIIGGLKLLGLLLFLYFIFSKGKNTKVINVNYFSRLTTIKIPVF